MTERVLLGFTVPDGKPFHIPMHHIVITGLTQLSGKTTTVEAILKRSGAKALVFKTKRGEKSFRDARNVPPYYRERFDWEYVRGLLEASMRERLKFETPWIIRICKRAKSLEEVRQLLGRLLTTEKRMREFDRNIYTLLAAYLDKVLPVLRESKSKFVDRLDLKPGLNVMDLTDWYVHEEVQMLVIRSCMEHILQKENNVVVALPEAWKLLPQSRNTPVKLYFEKFIREGAANGNYLIIDAQDLGGVDKTPLRQVSVWIMGKMMEANEVERLLKQTLGLKVPAKEIQTLPLGHFVVAYGDKVQKVYVLPAGVPKHIGVEVARGKRTPESVRDEYLKVLEVDEDLVWKEKYEMEKRKREECEKEFARQLEFLTKKARDAAYREAMKKVEELKKQWNIEEMQRTIVELKDENLKLKRMLDNADLKTFETLKSTLQRMILPRGSKPGFEPGKTPSEIAVTLQQPVITVKATRKVLSLTDKDLAGKVALIYANGELPVDKWFTVTHVTQRFVAHGWNKDPRTSKVLDKFCQWGFLEKHYAGKRPEYRLKMKPEEAKERGLLKVV